MKYTIVAAIMLSATLAFAQHNHDAHHPQYKGWVNNAGEGCCNDQDCGELKDEDDRVVGGVHEVRIEGEWCPVLSKHYLDFKLRPNVPNASTAHVCAWLPGAKPGQSPCQRFLCYQPKPLS